MGWTFNAFLNNKVCYSLHVMNLTWQEMLLQVRARFGPGVADIVEASSQMPGRIDTDDDGMAYEWERTEVG